MTIWCLIVARSSNGVIGHQGTIPWHLSEDLQFFKKCTWGNPIVMGRVTWESLPKKPLPHRRNIVLSSSINSPPELEREVYSSWEEVQVALNGVSIVFLIGGASLYELYRDHMDYLFITDIHKKYLGDRFFSDVNLNLFSCVASKKGISSNLSLPFVHSIYHRKDSSSLININQYLD